MVPESLAEEQQKKVGKTLLHKLPFFEKPSEAEAGAQWLKKRVAGDEIPGRTILDPVEGRMTSDVIPSVTVMMLY